METRTVRLDTGAEARIANEGAPLAAVLVNGGTARPVPGTWSATSELLARELAPRFPGVSFTEVRYRLKTWKAIESCIRDARAALEVAGAGGRPCLLVGFSMGGAVSVGVASHPSVRAVLGLAPWLPDQLDVSAMRGRRLDVVHGAWDRYLPGVPGVSPEHSRRGFERIRALGVEGTYTLLARALHGAALRSPSGGLVRLPRWRAWVEHAADAVDRFAAHA